MLQEKERRQGKENKTFVISRKGKEMAPSSGATCVIKKHECKRRHCLNVSTNFNSFIKKVCKLGKIRAIFFLLTTAKLFYVIN